MKKGRRSKYVGALGPCFDPSGSKRTDPIEMRRRGGVDLRSVDSTMGFWQGQLAEWTELVEGSVQFQNRFFGDILFGFLL